jgi:acyl-CoA reductase-like NAD-dependent aldehyde dehydrogenase
MKDQFDSGSEQDLHSTSNMPHSSSSSKGFFTFSNTVNGTARGGARVAQTLNPSTKQPLWNIPVAIEDDVNDAVAAAGEAFASWSRLAWAERGAYLIRAKEALVEIHDDMANLIMQETGKPVSIIDTKG